jgi:hypothetical protein
MQRHSLFPRRRSSLAAALAAGVGLAIPAAHAANFPFSAGFPGSNFGASAWTYVERDTTTSPPQETALSHQTMSPYTGGGCALNSPCWTPTWNDPTQRNQVPAFWSDNSGYAWQSYGSCCSAVTYPAKCLMAHPGNVMEAVARFTVPPKANGGSYTRAYLRGTIGDQDPNGGNGVNWTVELNGATQFGGSLLSNTVVFPTTVLAVQTGSVIDVVVDANAGDESFDSTAVCGAIVLS